MEKDGYKELFIVTESFLKDVEKNVEKLAALKEEKDVLGAFNLANFA